MTFETSVGDLYDLAPLVIFERIPQDIWRIKNISKNHIQYGIFEDHNGIDTDAIVHLFPEDRDLASKKLGAAIVKSQQIVQLRYRIKTGKSFRWIEEHCSLSYSESGELVKAWSFLWVSSLPAEWSLLVKGSEMWNTLNSKIRHDIFNQLTAILGYLELSTDIITDPMLVDFTKKEQTAAEKIRERLIFTREYQKIGLYDFSWNSLSDIIREAMTEISLDPIQLSIEAENIKIFADKNFCLAIGKIIENIPEHAKGATVVKISFTPQDFGGVLVIEDNGCGIPDTQKNRIFDLGFGSGDGYGLFLAEKILSVFGITLQEKGILGKGARFEMNIPPSILDNPV